MPFDNEFAESIVNKIKLEKIKNLQKKFNLEIEEERVDFLCKFYLFISDWKGQVFDLRDIFQDKEIEYLLTDSVNYCHTKYYRMGYEFIEFAVRSGYKNKPEVDEDGKPLLRRTTAIHLAATRGVGNTIENLFKIYDKFKVNYIDESGLTHFHVACKFGFEDVVEKFLEQGQDPNCLPRDTDGSFFEPPLHLALVNRHKDVAKLLLSHGADPNLVNAEGLTPLHILNTATMRHSVNNLTIILLTRRNYKCVGQSVQVDARDQMGQTPLHYALANGHKYSVQVLLENGANPILADVEGSTPLHIICKRQSDSDLAGIFFRMNDEKGKLIPINVQDKLGNTPLLLALKYGNKKVAQLLIKRGADPRLANKDGLTPLHIICQYYYGISLAATILEIGAEEHRLVHAPDSWGNTPLHYALRGRNMDMFGYLLSRGANPNLGNVNARDELGNTPLHYALRSRYKKMTELLLRRGANPNVANEKGSTPLHFICTRDELRDDELIKLFFKINEELNQLVQVDAPDNSGRTPLQWAVANIMPHLVDVLLDNGADLSEFVFPTASDFEEGFRRWNDHMWFNFKLDAASGAMVVIECLENRGYELNESDALAVMTFFASNGLFENSQEFEEGWYDDVEFASKAIEIMMNPDLSLDELIRLRPEEAAKQLTYTDYYELSCPEKLYMLSEDENWACVSHLCEKRMPILCCELILEQLKNEDLYNICLAFTGQSHDVD
ncbi:serine/threonine-protein phosphatase 6 regulatory ankyrin repeat subunit C-like [Trichogramma pretiosum]|uniref:serine/threonine-protein phosphatase 6 regulatory ankyrin repeat subunit C-like n=1 Tax=Trichogramma pretiosum TaxID=7493 RepID=UPI0006C9B51F|nr:serine/threonine-protein phosphatase 6 regulatory ankyrin repeat subunit C-like [Trichogramma pretiosum]